MKTNQLTILSSMLVLALGLGFVAPVFAAEDVSEAVKQHETLAAQYEAKAAAQDALIAEHTPMQKNYEERFYTIKKASKPKNVVDMGKHCTGLIQAAQAEKNELLEFAKWHRMRAAELQGQ